MRSLFAHSVKIVAYIHFVIFSILKKGGEEMGHFQTCCWMARGGVIFVIIFNTRMCTHVRKPAPANQCNTQPFNLSLYFSTLLRRFFSVPHAGDPGVKTFVSAVSFGTLVVFTFECGVKLLAEGYKPERYFTDPEVSILFLQNLPRFEHFAIFIISIIRSSFRP